MDRLEIVQIPVLADNYVYLLHDAASGQTAVVDPSVSDLVLAELDRRKWSLSMILNTHHHHDHVGGNHALKMATGAKIAGASNDRDRIPGIDTFLEENDEIRIGHSRGQVIAVPGHTSGHIAFLFPEKEALFCGDTLFTLGCGRLFEGTAEEMWNSLKKIRSLPDSTAVYCAHEYSEANAAFAITIDPNNQILRTRHTQIQLMRESNRPTVPSMLGEEKNTNPFLRADVQGIAESLNMVGQVAEKIFAVIRQRKNVF